MRNRTYGGVRGRKTKVGRKLLRFPPTRFVGATGFEPATTWSQTRRATGLRYTPFAELAYSF